MTSRPLRVATVITRLAGGAGRLALRGALAQDRDNYRSTIITGEGDRLLDQARAAGLEVLVEPALRAPIAPYYDLIALRRLALLLGGREFDVVHTHCAKAGTLGRLAAHRVGVPRIVHTFHGFPFHEFQSRARRQAYLTIERRLGRITDLALCVGTGVAVEAVRYLLVTPDAAARLAADAAASLGDRYDLSVLRAALDAAYLPGNATVGDSPGNTPLGHSS
jgi:hypothetical protein